jgi:hypothetical protein
MSGYGGKMRNVLDIMSHRRGPFEEGYRLLRSEYRRDPGVSEAWLAGTASRQAAAIAWLSAMRHINAGDMVSARKTCIMVHDLYANGDVLEEDLELFARVLTRYVHLVDITPERHEFLVTVEVTGHPSADEVAAQVTSALLCHFTDIPFGDNEEYDAVDWSVDEMDPEISPSYRERD